LTLKTPVEGSRVRTEDEVFITEEQAADVRGGRLRRVGCDVAAAAVEYAGTADMIPVVLAQNHCETWYISSHLGSAKMCFDWVHYASAADDPDAAVAEEYELEVELPQGSRSVVTEIAQCLSRRYGLAPQTQSKYERGAELTGAFAHAHARAEQAAAVVGV
jgi:inorganic triphosphatase YgiF